MKKIKTFLGLVVAYGFCSFAFAMGVDAWKASAINGRTALPSKETRSVGMVTRTEFRTKSVSASLAFAKETEMLNQYLPYELTGTVEWKTLFSSAEESVVEGLLPSSDGTTNYFTVHHQLENCVPLYWMGAGYPSKSSVDYEQVYNFVLAELCQPNQNRVVKGFSRPLDALKVKISQMRKEEALPYERFWFVFIDDLPNAKWAHPCRYVYLSEDLSAFTVVYRMWAPQIQMIETEEVLPFDKTDATTEKKTSFEDIQKTISHSLSTKTSYIPSFSGDISRSHFVLFCGGGSPNQNPLMFWAPTAMLYSTLTLKYQVPKDQIHVYVSDGTNSAKDAELGDEILVSSPLDLDGDGHSDVDGAATKANLQSILTSLKGQLSDDEQLVIFITSHGNADGVVGTYDNYFVDFDLNGNYKNIYDHELHEWTKDFVCPIAFLMDYCYSGGVIDDIIQTPNRIVATSCNHMESSWGLGDSDGVWGKAGAGQTDAGGFWVAPLVGAFKGVWSKSIQWLYGHPDVDAYPWEDGEALSIDVPNNEIANGKVSFNEAVVYAIVNDWKLCSNYGSCDGTCQLKGDRVEHPQFSESQEGVSVSHFYMLKQNDPPYIPEAPEVSINAGTMTWAQPIGAKYYKVYRSSNPFADPEPITEWITACEYECEDPPNDGTAYFYFVKAASEPNDAAAGPFNPVNVPKTPQNQYQTISYSKRQNYVVRPQYPEFHLYGCDAISDSYATSDTSVSSNAGASWSATFKKLGGGSDITVKIRANNGTAYDVANNPTVNAGTRIATWERLISTPANTSITPRAYSFNSNAGYPWVGANWSIEMGTSWPARTHYIYQAGIEHLSVTSTLPSPIRGIGGDYALTITATPITTEWTASTTANWIKLYQTSSTGSGVLGFKIEANEGSARIGYITITGASKTFTITIQQNGNGSTLSELFFYNPPSLDWEAALFLSNQKESTTAVSTFNHGDTIYLNCAFANLGPADINTNFTIRHEVLNTSGTVVNKTDTTIDSLAASYYDDWTGATWSGFDNLEPGTYTYRCTLDALKVVQESDETNNVYEYRFTILPPETLEVSLATLSIPSTGGNGTIAVSSNCAWTATTSANWITISPKSGSQNGTFTYTVAENTTDATRSAVITVTSATLQRQITVTQVASSLKPDLAFASFQSWPHNFGLFTARNQEDNPLDVVRMFNTDERFDIVFGLGNFGEGAINQSVKCKVEIYSETINDVLWNNVWDETVNLESMTGFSKRFHKQIWDNYSSGLYKIVLTLDADNQVAELDETDNTASFVFAIQDPISLNEGLGCSNLTFTNDGWYGTREADGTSSARTLHRGNNSENILTTTVVGPGTIRFSWKVSSETSYDMLAFLVDGQTSSEVSGTGDGWRDVSVSLNAGTHTLEWCYSRDGSRIDGFDCAWIRNVTWTPTLQAPVISSSTALTNGDIQLAWNAVAGATRYDLYRSTSSTRPATAYQTNVTSPYVDSNTMGGVTYYYWVAAVNGSAIAYSNRIQVQAKKTHDLTFEKTANLPWEESVFLSDSATNTTPIHQFTLGDTICVFFAFWNNTDRTLETAFTLRHKIVDAKGMTCASLDVSQTGPFTGHQYYGGTGLNWTAFGALQPGAYRYRITLDATNSIPEVDETNNVCEYNFTIVEPESLTVSKSMLSVSEEGESGLIDITANCAWTATSTVEWIQVSPQRGNGNSSLTYTVAKNASGEPRAGTIVVKSDTITCTITLTQESIPIQRSIDLAFAVFSDWGHGLGIFTAEHAEGEPEEPISLLNLNDAFDLVFGIGNFGENKLSSTVSMHAKIEAESNNQIVWSRTWNEDLSLASNRGVSIRLYDLQWNKRAAGLYRITVTLDADNQLDELDETDNTASFVFAIQDSISLNEGLGCSNFTFTNDGWYGTREADGTTSARTLHRGNNSENILTTTVAEPGTIRFSWKVSSETSYDMLTFLVDGQTINEVSGTGDGWRDVSVTLNAGTHTLAWRYSRDVSRIDGFDCAWIRNVTWTPMALAPVTDDEIRKVFTYTIDQKRTNVTITGLTSTASTFVGDIAIPERIEGVLVTSIAKNAIMNAALTGVAIPESVTTIGANAFSNCRALNPNSVRLPASIKKVDKGAFIGCAATIYPFVPGEKRDYAGYEGYKASFISSGLKLNSKTGVLAASFTKLGIYEGVFILAGSTVKAVRFEVSAIPTVTLTMEGGDDKCKVKGAGTYLVGKKVTLSATVPKHAEFLGWFEGETNISVAQKYTFVMEPTSREIVARFKTEDVTFNPQNLLDAELIVGATASYPLEITTESGIKSVSAKKLPTGLKVAKEKTTGCWILSGTPKKVGVSTATITVVSTRGTTRSWEVVLDVRAEQLEVSCALGELKLHTNSTINESIGVTLFDAHSKVKSISASKLPSGVKLVKTKDGNWILSGTPKKAGSYTIVLKVTTAAGTVMTLEIPLTVTLLPEWCEGSYYSSDVESYILNYGLLEMTGEGLFNISADGTLLGTLILGNGARRAEIASTAKITLYREFTEEVDGFTEDQVFLQAKVKWYDSRGKSLGTWNTEMLLATDGDTKVLIFEDYNKKWQVYGYFEEID